jgi:Response regulator containing CheY-like receiver domain and AraC-type DNA-binding domain
MNVLIVDDDISTIKYIRGQTNWEHLGINQIFEAQNILQAKSILLCNTIEIVLCDIEMPSGSGIELIEWIKEENYGSENIFITCHDEFKLAQKAISLGAFSYILKPVSIPELSDIISQAMLKYKENNFAEQLNQLGNGYKNTHSRIAKYPWYILLTSSNEDILSFINSQDNTLFSVIDIFITHNLTRDNTFLNELYTQLSKIINSFTNDYATPFIQVDDFSNLFVITPSSCLSHEDLYLICHTITKKYGTLSPLYCVFQHSILLRDVRDFFKKCNQLIRKQLFLNSQVVDFSLFVTLSEANYTVELPNMNSFLVMVIKGDLSSIQLLINEWEYTNAHNSTISKGSLSAFRLAYEEMVFRLASEYSINMKDKKFQSIFEHNPDPLSDIQTFHNYLYLLSVSLHDAINEQLSSKPLINKVKEFIHEHYMEEISMKEIAQYVNMNKDYLTKLYKQFENGSSPMTELLNYRLSQSKKLLNSQEFTISEIAAMTGFNSQSYFCKVFKQQLGYSPKDYRKMK